MLLLVVDNGVEELEDELLLFAGEELDLLELSLKLRGRARCCPSWAKMCRSGIGFLGDA